MPVLTLKFEWDLREREVYLSSEELEQELRDKNVPESIGTVLCRLRTAIVDEIAFEERQKKGGD